MTNTETSSGSEPIVAVLDIGKTNVKLSAVTFAGVILETVSVVNAVKQDGPWRHHDLAALDEWVFASLADLCRRHAIKAFVSSGHGSGGVLVGDDPDAGPALPMVDYEQTLSESLQRRYAPLAGTFFDRGSAIMHAATHLARQMYFLEGEAPEAFAKARWFLAVPQYWAWRLSGVATSEATSLGAQSHLWNVVEHRFAPIVAGQGWTHKMPPIAPAWQRLGPIRQALARRHGLPEDIQVLTGIHDSSANFYRYQEAGLGDATVVSTGTWIVALSGRTPPEALEERRNMTLNCDVHGRPVGGILTMGGREFTHVAGDGARMEADAAIAARMIAEGTMAVPTFGGDDGLFPGSAGRGHIVGRTPENPVERKTLAVLTAALLTVECLDALGSTGRVVLDGSFLRDPLYAALVSSLRPQGDAVCEPDAYGVASGAALLAGHETRDSRAQIALEKPIHFPHTPADLAAYRLRWQKHAQEASTPTQQFEKRSTS